MWCLHCSAAGLRSMTRKLDTSCAPHASSRNLRWNRGTAVLTPECCDTSRARPAQQRKDGSWEGGEGGRGGRPHQHSCYIQHSCHTSTSDHNSTAAPPRRVGPATGGRGGGARKGGVDHASTAATSALLLTDAAEQARPSVGTPRAGRVDRRRRPGLSRLHVLSLRLE